MKTKPKHIVILTGAGSSAASGLATFCDKGGIWQKYDLTKVATPEAYAADPAFVQEFYDLRRREARKVQPNAAHVALARLEHELREARSSGAHTVELDLEPSQGACLFADAIHGPASMVVPAFVAKLSASRAIGRPGAINAREPARAPSPPMSATRPRYPPAPPAWQRFRS